MFLIYVFNMELLLAAGFPALQHLGGGELYVLFFLTFAFINRVLGKKSKLAKEAGNLRFNGSA